MSTSKNSIIKYVNYPILLLAIISLLNIGTYVSAIIGFFKTIFVYPAGILSGIVSLALTISSLVLLVLLVLYEMGKLKNGNKIIGVVLVITELVSLYYAAKSLMMNPQFFSDIFGSPLISVLVNAFISLFAIWAGGISFKGAKPGLRFGIVFTVLMYLFIFKVGCEVILLKSGVISLIESLFYLLMLFNLPNLFNSETKPKAEITKKKIKVLVIVVIVFVCLVAAVDGSSDTSYSGSSSSYDSEYSSNPYGYTKPYAGESVSDYIKRQDPDLYNTIVDRYNTVTGQN